MCAAGFDMFSTRYKPAFWNQTLSFLILRMFELLQLSNESNFIRFSLGKRQEELSQGMHMCQRPGTKCNPAQFLL